MTLTLRPSLIGFEGAVSRLFSEGAALLRGHRLDPLAWSLRLSLMANCLHALRTAGNLVG